MLGLRIHNEPKVVTLAVQYRMMKNYNYLIIDQTSRLAVIVDPAWELDTIDQSIKDEGAILTGVLLTHSHPDHINLAGAVAEKYQCPIYISEEEIAFSGFSHPMLKPTKDKPWNVGSMTVKPWLTPGHTPGSVCFQVGDNLFTGDVLFAEGCGLCNNESAAHSMFNSLQLLKRVLSPHTRIFPGHSYGKPPGQYFSSVLQDNVYLQFKDKETFARFRLRGGQNKSKIFNFK